MATQAVSINSKIVKDMLTTLREIKEDVARLRKKIELEPPYGSDEWWEREVLEGEREIRAGKYRTYKSTNELIKDLHKGV